MAKINVKTAQPVIPMIYAYTTPGIVYHDGWTKIGYTERDVDLRIKEQTQTANIIAKKEWQDIAIFFDGKTRFTDKEFHAYLSKNDIERKEPQPDSEGCPEWFKISGEQSHYLFFKFRSDMGILQSLNAIPYNLRNEQKQAVTKTCDYFLANDNAEYLWNAKPRFGKTLSAYDLCIKLKAEKVLIVTNRPAIANSWYDDYVKFLGTQSNYYFVSNVDALKEKKYVLSRDKYQKYVLDTAEPKGCIEFVSLQDLKGSIHFGGYFDKLGEVAELEWDVLIIDEAHEGVDTYKTDIAFDKIKRKFTLHLSGTPFKALANEKFPESAIFNWTYADEQEAKKNWDAACEEENPYANLPQLNLFTYKMSDIVLDRAIQGADFNEDGENEAFCWDLNEFFVTNASGNFVHDKEVDRFLDALTTQEKFPFSTEELRSELNHTLWLLKYVSSAKALARKLNAHPVFGKNYKVVLAAGDGKVDNEGNFTDKNDEPIKKSYDSECGQIEFGRLINGKATCTKCGHAIALTDNNVSKFFGENALMRAAQSVNEKKAKKSDEQQNASPAYLPKARSFYYNKTTYGINLPEFKALHEVLFSDCAIDKVFVTDDKGTISFSPDYDNYLRIICEKGVDTKLYKSKVRIIREINSASNALYGAMAGFYWYFNEFGLTKSSSLHWRVGDALFAFKSPQDYVSALCSADAKKRQAIISLFNEQTCQYFFKNYEYSIIELSHLIYDTTGKFVYIAENNDTFIDFDSNFINHLSDFDDKIAARNDFIEAIHDDRIFWDKIKGSMDDYDGYFSTADETYYDRLCFYQFAIQGKSIVKYKSLQIRDSKEGIEYIKSVVTSAYLRRDNNTQMRFRDLTQMLLKTALFNSMIIGTEGVVKSGQIGSIPFIERLTELVSETNNTPSLRI